MKFAPLLVPFFMLALVVPVRSQHCDRYYVIVCGSQLPRFKAASKSHTWATFLHQSPDGSVDRITISWLPCTGKVRPLALKPEAGRNFTFEETVRWNHENKMVAAFWGPYEIEPTLWEAAHAQWHRLQNGEMRYQANDGGAKEKTKSNCVHAVSMIVRPEGQPTPVVYVAPINWGESGSFWTTLALRPWFIDPCCMRDEMLQFLPPDMAEMERFGLDRNPTRDPVIRFTQGIFQRKLLPNSVSCP